MEKDEIDRRVEREQDNLRKITERTDKWLKAVKSLMEEDEELRELMDEETRKGRDQCCFRRVHCNLYQRYTMSKKAQEKANRIDAVIRDKPKEVTEPVNRSDLKSIPAEFLKSLRSRVDLLERILNKLQDGQVDAVGIFGMGAVGKTTLVKEIANRREKDMFDKIIMVEISEAPNLERIQDQIAEQIGLNLADVHSKEQRAKKLYNCLKRKSKLLVILDNMWAKLDLGRVGIPDLHENSNQFCCKLLVTSREKNMCEAMGVLKENIFEVKPLDYDEARQLFRIRVGDKGHDDGGKDQQQEAVEKRLLNKCGGLPLAIVALADVLKDEELSTWEHFASELEKPISKSQAKISNVHRQAYSILETGYKLMESEKKKRFFMLASLFPFGASIPVEEMMRYGIGLDLFEHVDNLIEAMELANTWTDELKSSSLLLEDDRKGHVKIHDVVRASTISLAEKGGDMFMVEAFPRWLSLETCQKYYAISLMSGADHSRLNGLNSDKLQILRLNGSQPQDRFPDTFVEGMTNLKVLVLKGMRFHPHLPKSIAKLKMSLRTLHLENCELGDITGIGDLTNLVVLSLRG